MEFDELVGEKDEMEGVEGEVSSGDVLVVRKGRRC
jgi:hypothetical protein